MSILSPLKRLAATAFLLSTICSLAAATPGETFADFTTDGGWCWFSDPRAVTLEGKTYSGWVTEDGSIQVAQLHHASGRITERSKARLNRSAAETSLTAALTGTLTKSFHEILPALLNNCLRLPTLSNTLSARFSARLLSEISRRKEAQRRSERSYSGGNSVTEFSLPTAWGSLGFALFKGGVAFVPEITLSPAHA